MQVVAEEVGGARQSATAKVEIFLLLLFLMSCHERASIFSGGGIDEATMAMRSMMGTLRWW